MTVDYLQQNWALLAASVIGVAVLLFALWRAWRDSARGRLGAELARLAQKRAHASRLQRRVRTARTRLEHLQGRAEHVQPRRLQEAAEALQDAEALARIAADQVLIAENHVRKIIVEEFPPKRHEALRARYLPGDGNSGKPFSF